MSYQRDLTLTLSSERLGPNITFPDYFSSTGTLRIWKNSLAHCGLVNRVPKRLYEIMNGWGCGEWNRQGLPTHIQYSNSALNECTSVSYSAKPGG